MTKGKRFISGQTIPAVAKRLGLSEAALRRAVDGGEVNTITFNGVKRIPPAEEERVAGFLGVRIVRHEAPHASTYDGFPF
jgi:hypothetical protein